MYRSLSALILTTLSLQAHDGPAYSIEQLSSQLKTSPNQPHLWVHMAELHREAGHNDKALAACLKAKNEGAPINQYACLMLELLLESLYPAEVQADLLRQLTYEQPCQTLLSATLHSAQGRPAEAVQLLDNLLRTQQLPPDDFHDAVRTLHNLSPEIAIQHLEEKLCTQNNLQDYLLLLTFCQTDPQTALRYVHQWGTPHKHLLPALHRHAALHAAAGDVSQAVTLYEQALHQLDRLPPHRKKSGGIRRQEATLQHELAQLLSP